MTGTFPITARGRARAIRSAWRRARFRAWSIEVAVKMRLAGGRLVIDAPAGAELVARPRFAADARGDGDRTFTLRFEPNVRLGRGVSIDLWAHGTNELVLGEDAWLTGDVRLQLRSGRIAIGAGTQVRDFSVLKSDGDLVVGERTLVSHGCILHCTRRIDVGDLVALADRVTVTDSDHAVDGSDTHYASQPLLVDPVTIGRNVLVSAGVVVLRGARIAENAVVAAASVVRAGDYPAGWLVAGVPARPVKALPAADARHRPSS